MEYVHGGQSWAGEESRFLVMEDWKDSAVVYIHVFGRVECRNECA